MTRPWQTLATVATADGPLELRRRGRDEASQRTLASGNDEFLIVIAGRVLMTSRAARSEILLAELACKPLTKRAPHVLIGGLGMAFTLRAALDALPATARVTVAELTAEVATWCRGPLAPLTSAAAADPRVTIVIDDVARVITAAPRGRYDAIVLDLYEGPHAATQHKHDPFYSAAALARSHAALAPAGLLAVWSEDPDDAFARRFTSAGFDVSTHRVPSHRTHVVYLGART